MKKYLIWIILVIFISCTNQKQDNSKPPIKVIVFADKTGSIDNNSIPKLSRTHLEPIIDYIKNYGGEIALSDITHISKQNLGHGLNLLIYKNSFVSLSKKNETLPCHSLSTLRL